MGWLLEQLLFLLGIGVLLLLVAGVLAPLESLGWWAGWSGKPRDLKEMKPKDAGKPGKQGATGEKPAVLSEADYYIVYLSGIGLASADGLAPDETDFISQLQRDLPTARVITDVFPYSVNNNPLTGERALSPLWRKVRQLQEANPDNLVSMLLINIRNLFQVAVSADPRYGPIYSIGVADEIARSLARHGYQPNTEPGIENEKPVYLIGFSGGGQVAVGVAPYLAPIINAPIVVLSIGGVISDDPGIKYVHLLTHFYGEKDSLQKIGKVLWSGRWPILKWSDWNQTLAQGRIRFVDLGPMAHNSHGGYYDIRVRLPDGRNFCEATSASVKKAIYENAGRTNN